MPINEKGMKRSDIQSMTPVDLNGVEALGITELRCPDCAPSKSARDGPAKLLLIRESGVSGSYRCGNCQTDFPLPRGSHRTLKPLK